MMELLIDLCLLSALWVPLAIFGTWFFGLRRFILSRGRTTVRAAVWGLSMWADWTVAREIGKEAGRQPFCVHGFTLLHLLLIAQLLLLAVCA